MLALGIFLYHDKRSATGPVMKVRSDFNGKSTIIIYNRVPKCGSTLLQYLLEYLSRKSKTYTFLGSRIFFKYRLSLKQQAELAKMLSNYSPRAKQHRVLYHQHVHFFRLNTTSDFYQMYINQIRDPLSYAMSNYDFKRSECLASKQHTACRQLRSSLRNLTMNDCVATGDPARCLTRPYGIGSMISFFCGQASLCDDSEHRPTSSAALTLAKANIERFYDFVGILEYMKNSLELLEHVHPPLFTGITRIYQHKMKQTRLKVTPYKHRSGISNETRAILLGLLKPEYELYEFVRQRFFNQYMKIFGRVPQSV
jgi:hypothetical protein